MSARERRIYVGTYTDPILFGTGEIFEGKGEGIYLSHLDPISGGLRLVSVAREVTNPSYLCLDRRNRHLYAVNELKSWRGRPTGAVSSFSIDAETGSLTFLNQQPTGGTDPCHVMLDATERWAVVSNFMSGSVCVFPVAEDGSLGQACDFIQHEGSSVHPTRQKGPHAHSTVSDPSGRFLFVPDLGLDRVVAYRLDSGKGKLIREEERSLRAKPGAGPRHIAFRPDNRFAYVINELDSTISACSFDAERGLLRELHSLPTLPDGYGGQSTCADVAVSPTGEFVYGSNRGHDSVVIYRSDPSTGRLSYVGHQSTLGRIPRNFAIDPSGSFLLAANQSSDSIAVFRIDAKTGMLASAGTPVQVPTPVCIKFADAN